MVDGASIRSCRPCPLREQCQRNGSATAKPRQGSRLLHPLIVGVSRFSGMTGVERFIGVRTCYSLVPNAWTCR
jgi:hypothetical protein